MSEPLCKCGHERKFHSGGDSCWTPHNFVGQHFVPCACGGYTPAPPPTREPIRLTDEAEAWAEWGRNSEWRSASGGYMGPKFLEDVFLAGFRAARLAGGPTLADAWDEGWAAYRDWMNDGDDLPDSLRDKVSPYRTPESEGD